MPLFRRIVIIVAGIVLVLMLSLPFINDQGATAVQPIQFNHQKHTKILPCDFCHLYYKKGPASGQPKLETCMQCHQTKITDSPEEELLRTIHKEKRPLRWSRVTRVPKHVRYSHQRHVVVGGLSCDTCHGEIAQLTAPPQKPLKAITMSFCIDCHQEGRLRVTDEEISIFRRDQFPEAILAKMEVTKGKSFFSMDKMIAAWEGETPGVLSSARRERISELVKPEQISTDCISCHR